MGGKNGGFVSQVLEWIQLLLIGAVLGAALAGVLVFLLYLGYILVVGLGISLVTMLSAALLLVSIFNAIVDIMDVWDECSEVFTAVVYTILIASLFLINFALNLIESLISLLVGAAISDPDASWNC